MSESRVGSNRLLLIVLVVVVLLFLCCCLVVAGLIIGGVVTLPWRAIEVGGWREEATERFEKTFDVSTPARLSVDVNVGDVFVRAGDGAQIRVSAVKQAWGQDRAQAQGYLDDLELQIRQTATGEVEIKTDMPSRLRSIGRTPKVDLEIAVPRDTDMNLTVNVGSIEVTGVQGAFEVDSNVGDVTLRDVRFAEDAQIESAVGNIRLYLPADIAFTFEAESNVGNIRVDFPIRNERSEKKVVGGRVEGEIGESPTVDVRLRANTGNIEIRQGR
jgi:DUF4097 and DUF4098 domain-containing protein YvlB